MHTDANAAPKHPSCYHTGYALTCAEYDALRAIRPGQCHVCGERPRVLFIEHDHALGAWAVRGLVCRTCNNRLRYVDAGKHPASPDVSRYLREAWHLTQDTTRKRARTRPRRACPTCGFVGAVNKDGSQRQHWSRLPGQHNERCTPHTERTAP